MLLTPLTRITDDSQTTFKDRLAPMSVGQLGVAAQLVPHLLHFQERLARGWVAQK